MKHKVDYLMSSSKSRRVYYLSKITIIINTGGNMEPYIFDVASNGLLNNADKIWVYNIILGLKKSKDKKTFNTVRTRYTTRQSMCY